MVCFDPEVVQESYLFKKNFSGMLFQQFAVHQDPRSYCLGINGVPEYIVSGLTVLECILEQ